MKRLIVFLLFFIFFTTNVSAHSLDEVYFAIDPDKEKIIISISWPQLTYLVTKEQPILAGRFESLSGDDAFDQHLELLIANQGLFNEKLADEIAIRSGGECTIEFEEILVEELDKPTIILGRGIPVKGNLDCPSHMADGFELKSTLFEGDFDHQVTFFEVIKEGEILFSLTKGKGEEKVFTWDQTIVPSVTPMPQEKESSNRGYNIPILVGVVVGIGILAAGLKKLYGKKRIIT